MTMQEPAGAWFRVSTGGQDETNQVPDIEKHCSSHGYKIAKKYELNDKSASKGEQQDKLDEVLADMRDGTIKVLVCWHSDRVERRGPEALFRLLRLIRDAGGRIESTKEPLLGTQDLSGESITAIGAIIAHQYSVHLGEQVRAAQERIRANNGFIAGGKPWGYVIVGEKYAKTLVPTDLCREVIPEIFQHCIDGDSCRTIAVWLTAKGVPTMRGGKKWSEGTIHRILTNMTYAGRRQNEGEIGPNGKPTRKHRQTIMTCEAVISMDTWQRAQNALRNRPQRGPGTRNPNRPMLASLKCARCARKGIDSPMYRIKTGRPEQKRFYYYRCAGKNPQRKGCGNMISFELTEFIVASQIFVHSTEPHRIKTWVEGQNWDDEISEVKQDIREAVEAERFGDMPALQARLAELRSRESVPGHWDYIETGQTVGEYFWTLDTDSKREYLKTRDIRAEKISGIPGIRIVIDGQERDITVRQWNAANRHLASAS